MLKQNATATMEAWNPKGKPNLTWSHPWATAFMTAIVESLVGIVPTDVGFATFKVQPASSMRGISFDLTVPSLMGAIRVNQSSNNDGCTLTVAAAANTKVDVCVYDQDCTIIFGGEPVSFVC
jgi:alpha-L-rhamnosidase